MSDFAATPNVPPFRDSAQIRAREIILNAVAQAHGLPGYVTREPETNHCLGCGVDADLVGVDGITGLCDECAGVGT